MLRRILKTGDSITPLILRISLGIVIFPHGYLKMINFTSAMEHLTHDYGLLWIMAFLVIMIEFFAAAFLLAGAISRITAMLVGIIMVGAIPYHWSNGFFMNWFGNQAGEGVEFHLLAIGIALAIVFEGGGKYSIDRIIYRKGK